MGTIESKRELVRQLLEKKQQQQGIQSQGVIKINNTEAPCLSYSQSQLWLVEQITPGSHQYNMPMAIKLDGELIPEILTQVLLEIVQRHSVLRTNFRIDAHGDVAPVVTECLSYPLPVMDICEADDQREAVKQHMDEESRHGFCLENDLMLRGRLLRLSNHSHVLLLTIHHIASDGWSMGVLTQELSALYNAFIEQKESPLVKLSLQYIDYAKWQRNELSGSRLSDKLNFWTQYLAGVPVLHQLPMDFDRPAVNQFCGENLTQLLDVATLSALNNMARQTQTTLFMLLQTAFACFVSKYSGEADIVLGTPVANREHFELHPLVGFFVNTLPLRTQCGAEESFHDVLLRSKENILSCFEHQQLPFEKIVEACRVERSLSYNPLFQIMFSMQNNERPELNLAGLTAAIIEPEWTVAKFDLNVTALVKEDGLVMAWEYSTALFKRETIVQMQKCFGLFVNEVLAMPKRALGSVSLLSAAEQIRTMAKGECSAIEDISALTLDQLISVAAHKTPEATAVIYRNSEMSYGELLSQSRDLARYLTGRGVRRGDLVGICIDRSERLIVSLIATLIVGAAYVPYDTAMAATVVKSQHSKLAVKLVLVDEFTKEWFAVSERLCVTADREYWNEHEVGALAATEAGNEHLAYVLSTSGSTGEPKQIGMSHRALVNLLQSLYSDVDCIHPIRTLQYASIGFDMSFVDIFLPLIYGGSVVLLEETHKLDFPHIANNIASNKINVINFPYSVLESFSGYALEEEPDLTSIHTFFSTAEQLKITPSLKAFFIRYRQIRLVNHYGPSETHVCTSYRMAANAEQWPILPPIGKPIANTSIYVLDQNGAPVPDGMVGELYVAGACLAQGYINAPDLTADRFITISNSSGVQQRVYTTGDRVRRNQAGELEYFGRNDQQIKIRGQRIEPGAIEAVLVKVNGIEQAVVIARDDVGVDLQLVAYVVAPALKGSQQTLAQSLAMALRNELPGYMVPSAYIWIEQLPLNVNGKVNRKALPRPEKMHLPQSPYVGPTSDVERQLCELWQLLLNRERVGIDDNFFEQGGHSLLATKLSANISAQFGVSVTVKAVFEKQTVRLLAQEIEQAQFVQDHLNSVDESSNNVVMEW